MKTVLLAFRDLAIIVGASLIVVGGVAWFVFGLWGIK